MGDGSPGSRGSYFGRLIFEPLPDGRLMRVVEAFGFQGADGRRWPVAAGAKVDGASIPRALWTFIGGPFEGQYRDASVVHDYYCDVRTAPWRDVHRMFFDAMGVSGVSNRMAKIMYAAVYYAGPRWSDTAVENANLPRPQMRNWSAIVAETDFGQGVLASIGTPGESALDYLKSDKVEPPAARETYLDLDMIQTLIDTQDPSLAEIDTAIDAATGLVEPGPNRDPLARAIVNVPPSG